jgi:hypothetical protein
LENPRILNEIGIGVFEYQIEEKTIWKEDYIKNIDEYVLTLDEWFEKNKCKIRPHD